MPALFPLLETFFRWILLTSWQAAILAGLILAAQQVLGRRLAPTWRYGLWLLLVARLLLPVMPPSGFSIFNLARVDGLRPLVESLQPTLVVSHDAAVKERPPAGGLETVRNGDLPLGKEFPGRSGLGALPPGMLGASGPSTGINWLRIATGVWLLGLVFSLSRLFWTNRRFRSRLLRLQPVADDKVLQLFDECRREFGIQHPVRIIESPEVASPGVYGLRRIWLLLPEGTLGRFSRQELRHTFLHELAHLKRRDLEVNWLAALLLNLHWFNPVIWLALARMRTDRELATDALVLARVSSTESVAYGDTIIKVAANLASGGAQPMLVGIAETKAALEVRLRAIAGAGSTSYWSWAAVAAAAILVGTGLTGARLAVEPKPFAIPKNPGSVTNLLVELSGRIVDPTGKPVSQAQVAICRASKTGWLSQFHLPPASSLELSCAPMPQIFNPAYGHPVAELPAATEPWNFCITDAQGHFFLNDLAGALGLVAVQESGFAFIPTNRFSKDITIQLEPWGRVEGTLRRYQKPIANEPVHLWFVDYGVFRWWGRKSGGDTRTDGQGHFHFDFVPPARVGLKSEGDIGEPALIKSGATTVVELGGGGWPVVGKFRIRSAEGEDEPADDFRYSLVEKTAVARHRPVQCDKDGSFRIDDANEGTYVLMLETYPSTPSQHLIGTRELRFPARELHEPAPLDLGTIEIKVQRPQPIHP